MAIAKIKVWCLKFVESLGREKKGRGKGERFDVHIFYLVHMPVK
jgi:hypothetical protein